MGPISPPTRTGKVTRGLLNILFGVENALRTWSDMPLRTGGFESFDETARRASLIDPNANAHLKIERYSFSMSPQKNFSLGTPMEFDCTLQPNTRIRAQRIICNAPAPNFVILNSIQVANVNILVGTSEDAYSYNANGNGVMLDLPTLDPANRATVSGSYTGLVLPPYDGHFIDRLITPDPPIRPVYPDSRSFDNREQFDAAVVNFEAAMREWMELDRQFAISPPPSRKVTEKVPFSFQFIITFQGRSIIIDGL